MIELFVLASETTSSGMGLSQWLELGVVLSTIALVLVTAGLWKATADVHHDEIMKMSENEARANDNMTEVALAEIHAHHVDRMKKIRHRAKGKVAQ